MSSYKTPKEERMKAIEAAEADQEQFMAQEKKLRIYTGYIQAKIFCKTCKTIHWFRGKDAELVSEQTRRICPRWKEHKNGAFHLIEKFNIAKV